MEFMNRSKALPNASVHELSYLQIEDADELRYYCTWYHQSEKSWGDSEQVVPLTWPLGGHSTGSYEFLNQPCSVNLGKKPTVPRTTKNSVSSSIPLSVCFFILKKIMIFKVNI